MGMVNSRTERFAPGKRDPVATGYFAGRIPELVCKRWKRKKFIPSSSRPARRVTTLPELPRSYHKAVYMSHNTIMLLTSSQLEHNVHTVMPLRDRYCMGFRQVSSGV
jgi:hypothetical protein